MKKFEGSIITWLLLVFILIGLFNIYVLIKDRDIIYQSISDNIYQKLLDNTPKSKDGVNGKDGYIPIKGVDYFDGDNGRDGTNGVNGAQGAQGEKGDKGDKGEAGANGYTPQIRCNTSKNRWEVRYSDDTSWEVLNGEKIKCTISS